MTRALLLFTLGTVIGKILGTGRQTMNEGRAKAFRWVFLLVLAFIMPILFTSALLQNGMLADCTTVQILLPLFLTSLLLWLFWNWNSTCCCGNSCTMTSSSSHNKKTVTPLLDGADIKGDDLTKIEGIGPKIEEVLYKNGIKTFKTLSKVEPNTIKDMLTKAGPQFIQHEPNTWPMQASLAASGRWDKLEKWQLELDGGRI